MEDFIRGALLGVHHGHPAPVVSAKLAAVSRRMQTCMALRRYSTTINWVERYITKPSAGVAQQHMQKLTASGPPLHVLLGTLAKATGQACCPPT